MVRAEARSVRFRSVHICGDSNLNLPIKAPGAKTRHNFESMSDEVNVLLEHTFRSSLVSSPGVSIAWTARTWKCKLAVRGAGSGQNAQFLGLHTWFRQWSGCSIPRPPHLNNYISANLTHLTVPRPEIHALIAHETRNS